MKHKNQSKIQLQSRQSSATSSTSTSSTSINSSTISKKNVEKQKRSLVTLMSDWICSNSRPINLIEDIGLEKIMDHCIQTGIVLILLLDFVY